VSTDRLFTLVNALARQVRGGHGRAVLAELRRWFWSDATFFGLDRDLGTPFEAPSAKIPLEIRPLESPDLAKLLDDDATYARERPWHIAAHRLSFAKAAIGTGYVAVTESDEPCYVQWLMLARQNDSIQRYFDGIFPLLAPDEALLEHAFTREDYQGLGIMPAAMARIAERAIPEGARRVITFVEEHNVAALKGCDRAGFRPYCKRHDSWRLFRRRVGFEQLPAGSQYPYER
jgi:GNAT superfamily N-acetyltransferase